MCETDPTQYQDPYIMNAKDERLVQLAQRVGKSEYMEGKIYELNTENDKLKRSLGEYENTSKRMRENRDHYMNLFEKALVSNNTLKRKLAKLQPKPKKEKK